MRKSGCEKLKENPSTRVHLFFFLFLFCSRGKYVIKEISLVHFYFRRGPGLSPRWGKQTLSSQLFWRRNAARVERHQIGASFVQPRPNGNPETRNRSKNTNFSVLRKPIIPNTKAEPGTSEVEPGICMVVSKKKPTPSVDWPIPRLLPFTVPKVFHWMSRCVSEWHFYLHRTTFPCPSIFWLFLIKLEGRRLMNTCPELKICYWVEEQAATFFINSKKNFHIW